MLKFKTGFKTAFLALTMFGSSSAFAADQYTYIASMGNIMSPEVCDAGILNFVTDKPIKISVKGEYASEVDKTGLRLQYLLYLYENERALFDNMAAQQSSPFRAHLTFANTPEESKAKMQQYGGFTAYSRCEGKLLVTPTAGFELNDPSQKPWGGVGKEKKEFLTKYFKDNYLGK